MVDIYTAHRNTIELFYLDKVTIYTIELKKDPVTKVQKPTRVLQYENIPCKLEFMNEAIALKQGLNFSTERKDLLVIGPDIYIEPGSKVEIIKESGRIYKYDSVGEVMDMETHNEYYLQNKDVAL